ncbi:DUF2933 domain-containing protein [Nitrospinota bacterium]
MPKQKPSGISEFLQSPFRIVLLTFLAIGGYFLVAEHRAHLAGYLPLILLLAVCGGMHFFMHGSHGHGPPDDNDSQDSETAKKQGEKQP